MTGNSKCTADPEAELESFIARLDPELQKLVRSVRVALRKRFPTANELTYDYPNALVVAYSATDRGIEGIVSFTARKTGMELHFNQGPKLPDPKKLLKGSGKQTRFIAVTAATQLANPDVKALFAAAVEHASAPLPAKGKGALIIKTNKAAAAKKKTGRVRS
jgi:hypothetical protein